MTLSFYAATISASLEKLKSECEEVKTMVPVRQNSDASELSASTEADHGSDLGTVSPLDSPLISPEPSPSHGSVSRSYDTGGTQGGLGHLELEDLDLLPTKEISSKSPHFDMQGQTYSRTCQNGKIIQNCRVYANRLKYVGDCIQNCTVYANRFKYVGNYIQNCSVYANRFKYVGDYTIFG